MKKMDTNKQGIWKIWKENKRTLKKLSNMQASQLAFSAFFGLFFVLPFAISWFWTFSFHSVMIFYVFVTLKGQLMKNCQASCGLLQFYICRRKWGRMFELEIIEICCSNNDRSSNEMYYFFYRFCYFTEYYWITFIGFLCSQEPELGKMTLFKCWSG